MLATQNKARSSLAERIWYLFADLVSVELAGDAYCVLVLLPAQIGSAKHILFITRPRAASTGHDWKRLRLLLRT